jgi:hypothetical protein
MSKFNYRNITCFPKLNTQLEGSSNVTCHFD